MTEKVDNRPRLFTGWLGAPDLDPKSQKLFIVYNLQH